MTIVKNGLVDTKELLAALELRFPTPTKYDCGEHINVERFKENIGDFIVDIVEVPASKQRELDYTSASIYDMIDNVEELRDTINGFIQSKLDEG